MVPLRKHIHQAPIIPPRKSWVSPTATRLEPQQHVNGENITLANATNANNTNTLNGINFPAATNNSTNVINAINFADTSNFTNIIKTPTFALTGAGALTGVSGITFGSTGNFDQSASSGTFQTGTGAVSLNGNTSVTGSKTFTVGTGATSLGWHPCGFQHYHRQYLGE